MFKMFCDYGGRRHEVEAVKLNNGKKGKVRYLQSDRVNQCTECGRMYPAPPSRGPRAPKGQARFAF